jgi:hypothetical protein
MTTEKRRHLNSDSTDENTATTALRRIFVAKLELIASIFQGNKNKIFYIYIMMKFLNFVVLIWELDILITHPLFFTDNATFSVIRL